MKKTILFLLVFCMLLTGLFAQNATHVTAERARNIGYTFMSTNPAAPASPTRGSSVSRDAMQLVYTGRAVDSTTRGTTDCYYVFSLQPKGFVIVAADERAEPILGYSYDNDFVAEGMPEHVRGWLGNYEQQIKAAIDQNLAPDAEIAAKWTRLERGQPLSNTRSGETVGPLLTTTWDQGCYYNAKCPEDPNGYCGGHVPTGCVATAMAQVINYWGYPVHGRGTHSYESRYGTLTVNYDSARYDYANMPDALTDTSTPEQINAVATLMRDCGVAVNMMYSASESGAYDRDGRAALINFFRFSPDISYAEKDFFTPNEWLTLLRENLDNNRPVLYSGHGNVGGHTFICDGYNTDRYYHFNFGWSGNSDGWYLTDAVIEFNSEQTAIIGIVPDSTGNVILGQTSGISTFTVDDPLEFYHLLGHNTYEGENYSNECYSTTIFTAVDSAKQLVLDIVSFEEQYITVYDSIMGDELAFLFQLQPTPLLSNSSMMSLLYQGYFSYNGFHLSISQNNGCRMVSNVTTSVDTTTIHLSWTENSDAIQWQVEYGLTGFQHGEGTLLTVDTTTINITGLTKFTTYDFYIRPVCDNRWFGPITETALAKYWTDVVTSQPEGYVEDEQGHIYISTAEGLAWLSKLAYEDQGSINHPSHYVARHVTITNDINLGQYRWNPIAYFYGVFDGQGHRIDSMVCIENESENSSFAAMIRSIHWENHATLKNILLTNCWVKSKGPAAGLIALKTGGGRGGRDTIINCFVSGKIEGTGEGTGVGSVAPIAAQEYALIVNCASNCKIIGKGYYCSGILADGMNGGGPVIMKNCYSASSVRGYATWTASVLGYGENATVENCYGFAYSLIAAGDFLSTFRDLEWFSETDSGFYLLQPILFDPDSLYYSNLKDVLNAGVRKCNWEELRVWVDDTADINGGMPILGPKYIPTCPNIQNLTAKNVEKQGRYGVELSWTETGEATTWEIKYHIQDSIDENHNPINEVRMLTMNNPDTLWDLSEQTTYLFSVRPVCSNTNRGGWSDEFAHVVDRAHWTKIITTQPEGYEEDAAGNVTISTAEGLAWLISTVNGLNGQTENHFEGKTVTLTQDVNIGQYKWTAINGFKGKFDGGNHSIRNLYINELADNQGLFGLVDSGSYINIKLDSANVKGIYHVGMLFGYINHAKCTFNCHVSGKVYGNSAVGGMAGGVYYCETVNACSAFGKVIAKYSCAGGLIGLIDGDLFVGLIYYYTFIRNSYAQCDVTIVTTELASAGGLVGLNRANIENCYALGSSSQGGLTGWWAAPIMENCYFGGTMLNSGNHYTGAITGRINGTPIFSHCYGLYDDNPLFRLVGPPYNDDDNPTITNTVPFVAENNNQLMDSVAVGDTYYTDLLSALNAWVDAYDTSGMFLHWVADTTGENGGFPKLEENGIAHGCDCATPIHLPMPTYGDTTATTCGIFSWYEYDYAYDGVTHLFPNGNANGGDSIVTLHLITFGPAYGYTTVTTCGSFNWHGEILTESGEYQYVIENGDANGCDSTDVLYLTIDAINTEIDGTNEEVHLVDPQENATYQWIDCETNELMEGDIADFFVIHEEGGWYREGYYACIITFCECTDTTECWHIYPDDITENEMGILTLYPNPTDGTVTVQLAPETCNLTPEIQMFDIYGRRLQIIPVTDETTPIDLSRYANGVYFVKLVNNGKVVAVRKVVKE